MTKKRSDTKSHEEWSASFTNDKVKILGRYTGRNHPIRVECTNPECGYIWNPRAFQIQKGQGCRQCQYREKSEQYRMTAAEFDDRLKEVHGGNIRRISADSAYKGVIGPIEYLCSKCGHKWITTGNSVINAAQTGCPRCCLSKNEEKVAKYLTERNVRFERGKTLGRCTSSKGGLSFFDFILNDDMVKVIEVDGQQHFQYIAGWNFEDTAVSDILKNEYCEKERIPLLRIRYDQIVKSNRYKRLIDDFLTNPNNYIDKHNLFLDNAEYYKKRDKSLMEHGISIPGLKAAAANSPKERQNKPVYTDANRRSYSSIEKMCRENHISTRRYYERANAGMTAEEIFAKKYVYDHKGNRFSSNKEMCSYWQVGYSTFDNRIKKGWSLEDALTKVSRKKIHMDKNGSNLSQRARSAGFKPTTILCRIADGKMKEEDALRMPLRNWEVDDGRGNTFKNVQEMCDAYGLSYNTYRTRTSRGMDKITALTTPINKNKSHMQVGYVEDHLGRRYKTNAEMCAEFGVKLPTFLGRRQRGWSLQDALTIPADERFWHKC